MKTLHLIVLIVFMLSLVACSSGSSDQIAQATATQEPVATATITQVPTKSYTPVPPTATFTEAPKITDTPMPPIEGRLFFDMNGSGLQDDATFQYDPARLTDPRQPLQADLNKSIDDYLSQHPELKEGDLTTIPEPVLTNYKVCAKDVCVTTDADGKFELFGVSDKISTLLTIIDPNKGNPAIEMRYINQWNGPVVVSAYTKDVDAATMAILTTIPGCDDATAQVCKQDADTLLVRDQHLNDTAITPLEKGISVKNGQSNEIGLVQGFLTLPFVQEQVPNPKVVSYFDIIGYRIFDNTHTFFSTQDGIVLNYNGQFRSEDIPHRDIVGVGDSHTGLDYLVPKGKWIVSAAPTSKVWYLAGPEAEELRVNLMFQTPENLNSNYDTCYAHLSVQLVKINQTIYRGQIVGLSGNTGIYVPPPRPPMLHFHLGKSTPTDGWNYLDPYRYTVNLDPLPKNFWGNPVSLWSSDNNPQFPLLSQENK